MSYSDTIYALATAAGRAGVAVVRASGPRAMEALSAFGIEPSQSFRSLRLAVLQDLSSTDIIDQALVVQFEAPNSFTGEDVVEFHLHGSRAVIQAVLSVLKRQEGFRLAEPGEFSRRAFENGKMDLTQAEGLADLIDAETEQQRKQALRQMSGALGALYDEWRAGLLHALAFLEAYIDFPEEEIPASVTKDMERSAGQLYHSLQSHLSNPVGERLRSGIAIVILGEPNVGKSSLMNALAKRDVAIVSDISGTTRDALEVQLDIAGYPVTLIDTAGIREHTADTIEQEGIRRTFEKAAAADLSLLLVPANEWPIPASHPMHSHLGKDTLVVLTKADLHTSSAKDAIAISTKTGAGIPELLKALAERVAASCDAGSDPLYTQERHRIELSAAADAIARFLKSPHLSLELRAEDLRLAARHLGRLTGTISPDEILGEIFSRFCIGK